MTPKSIVNIIVSNAIISQCSVIHERKCADCILIGTFSAICGPAMTMGKTLISRMGRSDENCKKDNIKDQHLDQHSCCFSRKGVEGFKPTITFSLQNQFFPQKGSMLIAVCYLLWTDVMKLNAITSMHKSSQCPIAMNGPENGCTTIPTQDYSLSQGVNAVVGTVFS